MNNQGSSRQESFHLSFCRDWVRSSVAPHRANGFGHLHRKDLDQEEAWRLEIRPHAILDLFALNLRLYKRFSRYL